MATELFMVRTALNALKPSDAASEESLALLPVGKALRVRVTLDRSGPHHRKFRALLSVLAKATDKDPDYLAALVKIGAGYVDPVVMADGRMAYIPQSTAFGKMSQIEFGVFYERALDFIVASVLPGVDMGELQAEVDNMIFGA